MCSVVCQVLNISGSNITGALPLTWGSPGALPALVYLELGHNSITGASYPSLSPFNTAQISDACYMFATVKLHTPFFHEGRHETDLLWLC